MSNKFNTKRTWGSLFISFVIHLIVFIALGFVFLKSKLDEKYIEVSFTSPVPKSKRKLQLKKAVTKIITPTTPSYGKVIIEPIPAITTAAKINGYSDVYLSSPPSENRTPPRMSVPKTHRITLPKNHPRSNTEIQFTRPEISYNAQSPIASLPIASAELRLPSDLSKLEKIDVGVDEIRKYREAIKRKIEEEKRYPDLAEENGYEGKLDIQFKLFADGKIDGVEVSNSSGYQILDNEAIRAVKNATPYPSMPSSLKRKYIIVEVPIVFKLR